MEYKYRYMNKDGDVRTGKGEVAMNKKEGSVQFDKAAMTIKAANIHLDWYTGDNEWGMILYWPEELSVQIGMPAYFDEIDLKRYRAKKTKNQ